MSPTRVAKLQKKVQYCHTRCSNLRGDCTGADLVGQRRLGQRLTKWSGGDRCHSGGFLLRIMPPSWQPVPACTRNGHSAGGPFINAATNAAGGPFFPAKTIKQQRAVLLCDKENWNRTRHRCGNACAGGLFYLPERWHCSDS